MTLVERSVDGQKFFLPFYSCTATKGNSVDDLALVFISPQKSFLSPLVAIKESSRIEIEISFLANSTQYISMASLQKI